MQDRGAHPSRHTPLWYNTPPALNLEADADTLPDDTSSSYRFHAAHTIKFVCGTARRRLPDDSNRCQPLLFPLPHTIQSDSFLPALSPIPPDRYKAGEFHMESPLTGNDDPLPYRHTAISLFGVSDPFPKAAADSSLVFGRTDTFLPLRLIPPPEILPEHHLLPFRQMPGMQVKISPRPAPGIGWYPVPGSLNSLEPHPLPPRLAPHPARYDLSTAPPGSCSEFHVSSENRREREIQC